MISYKQKGKGTLQDSNEIKSNEKTDSIYNYDWNSDFCRSAGNAGKGRSEEGSMGAGYKDVRVPKIQIYL